MEAQPRGATVIYMCVDTHNYRPRLDDASSSIKTANIQPAGAALLDLTLTKLQYITFTHKKKTKKRNTHYS